LEADLRGLTQSRILVVYERRNRQDETIADGGRMGQGHRSKRFIYRTVAYRQTGDEPTVREDDDSDVESWTPSSQTTVL